MSKNLKLSSLFRDYTPRHKKSPRQHVDSKLASSVRGVGHAAHALDFFARHPFHWPAQQNHDFPVRPSRIRPKPVEAFDDVRKALEFIALGLVPLASKLRQFEKQRESIEHDARSHFLVEVEASFGYSNWLAAQWLTGLPPGSGDQVEVVQAIKQDERSVLTTVFAHEVYALSSGSQVASGLARYITAKGYPTPVEAFLLASIDPLPALSDTQCRFALALSQRLPAIDRWMVLVRTLQSMAVRDGLPEFKSHFAVPRLLDLVQSIEATNLSFAMGLEPTPPPFPPSPEEEWLVKFLTGTESTHGGPKPHPFITLAREDEVAGQMAILDRQATVLPGVRVGGLLASVARQLSTFTARRASSFHRWFELLAHPEVASTLREPIGMTIRLRQIEASERTNIEQAMRASAGGFHQRALELVEQTGSVAGRSIALDSLLMLDRSESAVRHAAETIVNSSPANPRLPFDEIGSHIPDTMAVSIPQGVHRAIAADGCIRHGTTIQAAKRNDALEDVLELAVSEMPSKAVTAINDSGLATSTTAFFLSRICTPSVMDTVPVGNSTEEMLSERIAVLNVLRRLDSEQEADYEREIRDIATFIAARREIVSLNQLRVYVDAEGLQSVLAVSLSDDWERYRRFSRLNPVNPDTDTLKQFLLDSFPDLAILDVSDLTRTLTSEADRALYKIVRDVRDAFSTSHEFGLNGYLSGGIRHGNLEGLLRGPLVRMNLLGTFGADGLFNPPEAVSQLAQLGGSVDRLAGCFERFAIGFQQVVDEVLAEWVRIEFIEHDSLAIFDFGLSKRDLRLIGSRLEHVTTVERAADVCIKYWLKRVDACLTVARERIRGDLLERLNALLTELDQEAREVARGPWIGAFLDNFVAPVRGQLHTSVETLAEWFQRANQGEEGVLDPRLPIEVSAQTLAQMYPNITFNWSVEVQATSVRMTRRALKPWVDIIHTLMVNAAKHGGGSTCSIAIDFVYTLEASHLTIMNDLDDSIDVEAVDTAIAASARRLSDPRSLASVGSEGRSGLVKVLKYARIDLRCPEATVTLNRDGRRFVAGVSLPSAHIGARAAE